PFCGLFLAESGSRMPPLVFSEAAKRRTTMRSPSGFRFIALLRDEVNHGQDETVASPVSNFHAPDLVSAQTFANMALETIHPSATPVPVLPLCRGVQTRLSEWQVVRDKCSCPPGFGKPDCG